MKGDVYGKILNDVIEASRVAFEEEGIDMSALDLLQSVGSFSHHICFNVSHGHLLAHDCLSMSTSESMIRSIRKSFVQITCNGGDVAENLVKRADARGDREFLRSWAAVGMRRL